MTLTIEITGKSSDLIDSFCIANNISKPTQAEKITAVEAKLLEIFLDNVRAGVDRVFAVNKKDYYENLLIP